MQISNIRNNSYVINFGSIQNQDDKQNSTAPEINKPEAAVVSIPKTKIEECFDENNKLNPIIKKELDKSKFLIKTDKGDELLSIKDAIGRFVLRDNGEMCVKKMYHACGTYETVNKILEEGFDPKTISRTMYGPGFYFTGSEGNARNYGTAIMNADLKGHCVALDPEWYDAISTGATIDKIEKFTGADYKTAGKILNEYTRNLIAEDLGIDFAHCMGNYVCFNPDSIQNMQSQEHAYENQYPSWLMGYSSY